MSRLETPSLRKPGLDTRRSGHERGTGPPGPALEAQGTFPHTRPTYDPTVSRAGLLHAVRSSRRCGVVIALESGELPMPDRPHVCLRIDKRSAGVSNRRLGVHQGYHLVVLGDELSWLERRVVDSRCETTNPA